MDLATALATVESYEPDAVYMIRRGDGQWAVHIKRKDGNYEIAQSQSLISAIKNVATDLEHDSDIASLI